MNLQKIRYPTHMTIKPMIMFLPSLRTKIPLPMQFSTLENIYPNIMGLEYVNRKKSIEMTPEMYGKTEGKSNIELFSDFYKMQNGKEIEPESVKIIERIFKEIGGVNYETD